MFNIGKKRFIFSILFILFVCFAQGFSQTNKNNSFGTWQPNGTSVYSTNQNVSNVVSKSFSTSGGSFFIKTIVLLVVFAALGWGVAKIINTKTKIGTGSALIRELDSHPFSIQSSVKIINIGNQYYLIGVTPSQVNLISEITDKELIDKLILNESENKTERHSFGTLLGKYIKGFKLMSPLDNTKNLSQKIRKL